VVPAIGSHTLLLSWQLWTNSGPSNPPSAPQKRSALLLRIIVLPCLRTNSNRVARRRAAQATIAHRVEPLGSSNTHTD
jgi:hypothetical protein